jgi:hypothetical protein
MATRAAERPGVTNFDAQPRKIVTDVNLKEVPEDSEEAAFSWLASDLEARRQRREELGIEDSKAISQAASRKAELANAERRLARETALVEELKARVAADEKSGKTDAAKDDGK